MLYNFFKYFFRLVFPLYFRWKVYGREKVPKTGGVIIAANHASFLDPPLVGTALSRPAYFLAREDLFRPRWFGWLLRKINTVPLSRERASTAAFRSALEILNAGKQLVIFPEGTRSKTGRLGPSRPGMGLIWAKSGAPVVPAYISGSRRAFPPGSRWIRPRRITLTFGEPLRFEEVPSPSGGKIDYRELSRVVMARVALLRAENIFDTSGKE